MKLITFEVNCSAADNIIAGLMNLPRCDNNRSKTTRSWLRHFYGFDIFTSIIFYAERTATFSMSSSIASSDTAFKLMPLSFSVMTCCLLLAQEGLPQWLGKVSFHQTSRAESAERPPKSCRSEELQEHSLFSYQTFQILQLFLHWKDFRVILQCSW